MSGRGDRQPKRPPSARPWLALAAAVPLLFISTAAVGTTTVRLPTDGYVRPGRYFPVEVQTDRTTTLTADGCLPCDVAGGPGPRTVPMLAVDPPGDLRGGDGPPVHLRVPADDERLVAATTALPPAASALFPNARVISIRLDPADPLPGPPAAWEALDAVVLDPAAMDAVPIPTRSALLAGGVVLAVTGDQPPEDGWPWARLGSLWALQYAPAGPVGVMGTEAVYGPTEAWSPGLPPFVRGAVVAFGGLVAITTVGLLSTIGRTGARPRWRWAAAVGVSMVATVGVVAWRAWLDPVARARGDVTVASPRWTQRDAWVYERARSPTRVAVPWTGWTHPVFPSAAAAARARLTVSADGTVAFALPLSAGEATAFVRRNVGPSVGPPAVTGGTGTAMRQVAPAYLSVGDHVLGETAAPPGQWPGVAVARP